MDLAQAACAFGPIDPSADGGRGLQVAAMSDANPVRVLMYMRPSHCSSGQYARGSAMFMILYTAQCIGLQPS